jgi:hypothetical protein
MMVMEFTLNGITRTRVPNLGDGTYKNPIIHTDYSGPDVVQAGDFYITVFPLMEMQTEVLL